MTSALSLAAPNATLLALMTPGGGNPMVGTIVMYVAISRTFIALLLRCGE